MRPKNSATQITNATDSLSTRTPCASAKRAPAQVEARFRSVEIASDTSSRKPNAST
jgi:hypothetical protein